MKKKIEWEKLSWEKMENLLPVVVQDAATLQILMLGYMNQEALKQTIKTGWVTFYSRSKNRLWMKGETSGNKLALVDIKADCDGDSLLIIANPRGKTCHLNTQSCFGEEVPKSELNFLNQLEALIQERDKESPPESYTVELLSSGLNKIAQKVGEEGVEVVIAALAEDKRALSNEAADLLYHLLVLLYFRALSISDVMAVLRDRFSMSFA